MIIHPDKSCLLVIDIQDKLVPAISNAEQMLANSADLIEIAALLKVPVLCSEQYPKGLGGTIERIRSVLPADTRMMEKLSFSCAADSSCNQTINSIKPGQIVICGMETHVCVLQSAIQLKQQAREVYVVADAVGSRSEYDKQMALERLRHAGVQIVTKEMVMFEWLQRAGSDEFKTISKNYLR